VDCRGAWEARVHRSVNWGLVTDLAKGRRMTRMNWPKVSMENKFQQARQHDALFLEDLGRLLAPPRTLPLPDHVLEPQPTEMGSDPPRSEPDPWKKLRCQVALERRKCSPNEVLVVTGETPEFEILIWPNGEVWSRAPGFTWPHIERLGAEWHVQHGIVPTEVAACCETAIRRVWRCVLPGPMKWARVAVGS
jgi:hypothetical protein